MVNRLILDAGLTAELVKLWNEQTVWVPKLPALFTSHYLSILVKNKYLFLNGSLWTTIADAYDMHNLLTNWARVLFLWSLLCVIWSCITSRNTMKAKHKMHITPNHTKPCQDMLFSEENKIITSVRFLSWYAHMSEIIWTHTCTHTAGCLLNIRTLRDKWLWAQNNLCHACSLVSYFTNTLSNIRQHDWL